MNSATNSGEKWEPLRLSLDDIGPVELLGLVLEKAGDDWSPKTPIATAILTRDIVQLRRNGYRRNLRDTAQSL